VSQLNKHSFLVTGFPRSRTAWLANFLTYGESFCFHEAINGCYDWKTYFKKLSNVNCKYVGNSDSGVALSPLVKQMPEIMPVVIIERDKLDVIDSLENIYGEEYEETIFQIVTQIGLNLSKVENALRIPFEYINENLSEICMHCIGTEMNENRAESLINMNIQTKQLFGDPETIEFLTGGEPWLL